MEKKVKEINSNINEYVIEKQQKNYEVFNNMWVFYQLSKILEKELEKYGNEIEINYDEITKIGIFEQLELIKRFYKDMNVNLDIEKLIQDGTLKYLYYDLFYDNNDTKLKKHYKSQRGKNYYEGDKKLIDSTNTGLISDVPILIHELSHYRNQPELDEITCTREVLTESLAIAEELIFIDYISKLGYESEAELLKNILRNISYNNAKDLKIIYKVLNLFTDLGSVSKSSYEFQFCTEKGYEELLDVAEKFNDEYKHINIVNPSYYIIGTPLAIYMYQQYKEDNTYINTINLLHEKLNTKLTTECFETMGLEPNDFYEGGKIEEAIKKFNNEEKVKILKK